MMNMLFVVAQQTSRHRLDWADVIHYSEEGYHVHDLNSSTDTQDASDCVLDQDHSGQDQTGLKCIPNQT